MSLITAGHIFLLIFLAVSVVQNLDVRSRSHLAYSTHPNVLLEARLVHILLFVICINSVFTIHSLFLSIQILKAQIFANSRCHF